MRLASARSAPAVLIFALTRCRRVRVFRVRAFAQAVRKPVYSRHSAPVRRAEKFAQRLDCGGSPPLVRAGKNPFGTFFPPPKLQ
jgi:hypothetical protein